MQTFPSIEDAAKEEVSPNGGGGPSKSVMEPRLLFIRAELSRRRNAVDGKSPKM